MVTITQAGKVTFSFSLLQLQKSNKELFDVYLLTFMLHWELGSYCHPRFRSMDMDEQNIFESKFQLIYDIRVTDSYAFLAEHG